MNEDRLSEVFAFVEVARGGSFVRAAKVLRTTAATVSRRVARLEDGLGARLLTRTTRRVALTEAGAGYLQRCEPILKMLHDVDLSVADETAAEPRGTLRVSLPGAFGRRHGAPALAAFRQLYPQLCVDVTITDRFVDLVEEHLDVAIRLADLPDSGLVARKLAPNRRILCAAPEAVARRGMPREVAELADHNCLMFAGYEQGRTWRLGKGETVVLHSPAATVISNDAEVLLEMALAGAGVTMLPTFMAGPAIRDGRLVRVLPEWSGPLAAIWAIHASRRLVPTKVRSFIDFLVTRFAGTPPWED